MSDVIPVILKIYGLALIGYVAVKVGWFSDAATDGLIKFVFNFGIPPLLFRSLSQMQLPETLPLGLLGAYYLGVLFILLVSQTISHYYFQHPPPKQVISGFGSCFSNTVLLGIPIILSVFGEAGKFPLFLLISFHGVTLLTSMTLFLEIRIAGHAATRKVWGVALGGVLKNPIIWGIFSGATANYLGLTPPPVMDEILALLGQTAVPCSLFGFGAMLAGYKIAGELAPALLVVFMKNIAHPAAVWLLSIYVFGIHTEWAEVAAMLAAMPTGFNIFLFAHQYRQGAALATTAIFLSTVTSIFTVALMIFLFGR